MRHSTSSLIVRGGITLFTQLWEPDDDARATVLLSHGFAEHSGRYSHVAEALTDAGFAVAAYDQRGHGRSGGQRAVVRDVQHLADDLALVREQIADGPLGGLPQVLLGHSMGGATVIAHLAGPHEPVAAVVLSGPYLRNAANVAPPLKVLAPIIGRILPGLPTQSVDSSDVSRDPEVVHDYDTDPLNYRGGVPAGTAAMLLGLEQHLLPKAAAITEPMLVLHGGEDRLAAVAGSRDLLTTLGSADATLKVYPGLYHEIFNEPERKRVLDDVVGWLADRVPPA